MYVTVWFNGSTPCVHHEEVMTSKWPSLVFAEVIERWQSYNNLIFYCDGYLTMSIQIMIDYTLHGGCLYDMHYENMFAHTL